MIDLLLIAIVGLLLIGLIVFINVKNTRDRKELENSLNNDYRKPRDEEGEVDRDLKSD